MFLKVIACEVALREFCYAAARARNLVDLEFLTQGYHDTPGIGRTEVQKRINAVPCGKYDAIVLGYGLCSNILAGLTTAHTRLVIPRAHDCITFFLGSKERYQEFFESNPGTYYFTSGWLECAQRRQLDGTGGFAAFSPIRSQAGSGAAYDHWVRKYGEEKARYLVEAMGEWSANYTRGVLIDYPFTRILKLREQVQGICGDHGWEFVEVEGDLGLFQRLLDGDWREPEVLTVEPGQKVAAAFDGKVIVLEDGGTRTTGTKLE